MAKSKPVMSLVSNTANRPQTALGSSASNSPETLEAQSSNSDRTSSGRPVAETTRKPIGTKLCHHNLQISGNNVGHLEKSTLMCEGTRLL